MTSCPIFFDIAENLELFILDEHYRHNFLKISQRDSPLFQEKLWEVKKTEDYAEKVSFMFTLCCVLEKAIRAVRDSCSGRFNDSIYQKLNLERQKTKM